MIFSIAIAVAWGHAKQVIVHEYNNNLHRLSCDNFTGVNPIVLAKITIKYTHTDIEMIISQFYCISSGWLILTSYKMSTLCTIFLLSLAIEW